MDLVSHGEEAYATGEGAILVVPTPSGPSRGRAASACSPERVPDPGSDRWNQDRAPPRLPLLLVALARPGLGAEAPLQLAERDARAAGRRAAGRRRGRAASGGRCRATAARAWARRAASGSAAARARRRARPPRRGGRGRAAVERAGLDVDVGGRVAGRAQPLGHGVDAEVAGLGVGHLVPGQRARDARVGGRADRVRRRRRCGRARSGCSRRTRRGAPPSTTCSSPGRARGARPRAPARARRGGPRCSRARARSAR